MIFVAKLVILGGCLECTLVEEPGRVLRVFRRRSRPHVEYFSASHSVETLTDCGYVVPFSSLRNV